MTPLILIGVLNLGLLFFLLQKLSKPAPEGDRVEKALREEMGRSREEGASQGKLLREEVSTSLSKNLDSSLNAQKNVADLQRKELDAFGRRLEELRAAVESKLKDIQADNSRQLDRMRETVDEKLQSTLEKRLSESFKTVSERLEAVHQGLGDMQALAGSVGDLKKVLTNVKTRGTWGEIQLESILELFLSPDQYERNVAVKPRSGERVEFAVRYPGPDEEQRQVWLPIDSKFPQEDYHRLLEAQERGEAGLVAEAAKALEIQVKSMARDIRDKYIAPPDTTNFAILFVPTEGLFAEILRRPGLFETLQREFRVTVAGPTTLAALVHSLQVGFRTLAIQKRSGEVWKLLGGLKSDFGRFGDLLEKTQKKLEEAGHVLDDAKTKTRSIERRLDKVQELSPGAEAGLPGGPSEEG